MSPAGRPAARKAPAMPRRPSQPLPIILRTGRFRLVLDHRRLTVTDLSRPACPECGSAEIRAKVSEWRELLEALEKNLPGG